MPVRARFAAVAAVLAVAVVPGTVAPVTAAAVPAVPAGYAGSAARDEVAFTVRDPRIDEASGLAASRRHAGVHYMHNDSGDGPRFFAVGSDGRTRATFTVAGAQARDWEAMAAGRDAAGRPALFIGDIGDNLGGAWPYVTVYRVREPAVLRDGTLRATAYKFKYEDGPRNAEAMMIDPRTGRLYIASKLLSGAALYRAPARLRTDGFNVLRKVGDAPMFATDAAYAPDGASFTIRTYFAAHVYRKPDDEIGTVDLPGEEQGESITYAADGRSLLAGSEGSGQPVHRVPLPDEAMPAERDEAAESPGAPRGDAADGDAADGDEPAPRRVGLFAALALAVAGAYWLLRRRA